METQTQDTKKQFGTKTSKIIGNIAISECDFNASENGNLRDLLSALERIRQAGITAELYSQLDTLVQNNLRLKNNCDIAHFISINSNPNFIQQLKPINFNHNPNQKLT